MLGRAMDKYARLFLGCMIAPFFSLFLEEEWGVGWVFNILVCLQAKSILFCVFLNIRFESTTRKKTTMLVTVHREKTCSLCFCQNIET